MVLIAVLSLTKATSRKDTFVTIAKNDTTHAVAHIVMNNWYVLI